MAVTPKPGSTSVVSVGGTAVTAIPAGPLGGVIQNPLAAADQGLGAAEVLYVDPVAVPGSTPGDGNGTTFVIYPGQTWSVIPEQSTPTRVNAASSGHKFSCVRW